MLHTHVDDLVNKHHNMKNMVDPTSAVFLQEKELILDNIDLVSKIFNTTPRTKSENEADAKDFLLHNEVNQYGRSGLEPLCAIAFLEKQKNIDDLSPSLVGQYTNIVKNFYEKLSENVNPHGNETPFERENPNESLHKALFSMKLYQYGSYLDEKVRKYTRHFYNRLVRKAREITLEMLVMETSSKDDNNKGGRKGGKSVQSKGTTKSKRRKRNKKQHKNQNKDGEAQKSSRKRSDNQKLDDDEEEQDIDSEFIDLDKSENVSAANFWNFRKSSKRSLLVFLELD